LQASFDEPESHEFIRGSMSKFLDYPEYKALILYRNCSCGTTLTLELFGNKLNDILLYSKFKYALQYDLHYSIVGEKEILYHLEQTIVNRVLQKEGSLTEKKEKNVFNNRLFCSVEC
jgi:hypothetical protein